MAGPIGKAGGKAAWKGSEIDYRKEGLHVFSAADVKEIDRALVHLRSLGDLDFAEITRAEFPLDRLGEYLGGLERELRFGRGFMLLRGLPRERYSADDMARIYFGFGAYMGSPLPQSYQGELLGHVIDVSDIEDRPRAYHAGGHIGMHTDSGDIVGLMCLRTAPTGGASRIASSVAVHDAIVERRLDLAETLYRGFYYRRMDQDAQYGTGFAVSPHRIPAFSMESGEFSCYFLGGYARRAARAGDVELSPEEDAAIDEAENLAGDPEFYLDMDFADGDIQFINNRVILHGRTDYPAERVVAKRRHLLRLWLKAPNWPALPEAQVFHTARDRELWLQRRMHLGELPSTYLKKLETELAAKAA